VPKPKEKLQNIDEDYNNNEDMLQTTKDSRYPHPSSFKRRGVIALNSINSTKVHLFEPKGNKPTMT
jgi:hypothetical protein